MDFLDEEDSLETERADPRERRRPARRRGGGSPNRQVLMRRAVALGVGLLILILLALGVRGCLSAREDRAMRDYVRDMTSIVNETNQASANFFERLENPGALSVTEFVDEVNTDRSAVDTLLSRVEALDPPGPLSEGHRAIADAYEMRALAMNTVAEEIRTALGEEGRDQAINRITRQMSVLYSSDYVYALLGQIPIDRTLNERGMNDTEMPTSQFVPDGVEWLAEDTIGNALGAGPITTAEVEEADDDLIHGTGLIGTSINGVDLQPDGANVITTDGTPEITVQFQNQGEAEENDVTVSVTVGDQAPLTGTVPSILPGVTEAVTIPITPTPTGPQTVEIEVEPVPGELVLENNVATYEVDFG